MTKSARDRSAGPEEQRRPPSDLPRGTGFLRPLVDRVAFTNTSVHNKLLNGFLFSTLLVILMAILSATVLARLNERIEDLTRLQERVDNALQMEHLITAQSHYRAMSLLTQDESNIQKIANAKQVFRARLDDLERSSGPGNETFFRNLRGADLRFDAASQRVLDLYRAGDRDGSMRLHLGQEHVISHELETAMQQLQQQALAEMVVARAASVNERAFLSGVVAAGSALALLTAVLLGFVFSWAFIRPVRTIDAALSRIAAGDFSQRAEVVNRDELGTLSQNLNLTSERLSELYGTLQALNTDLREKNDQLLVEGQKRTERTRILVDVMRALSSELELDRLLGKIMDCLTTVMQADRSTLLLLDPKTNELWSKVAQGIEVKDLRMPATAGIAGHVVTTGTALNVPDAYADPRFNPNVDRQTGYRTKSILAVPMRDETGQVVGVVECLNKKDGSFTADDEELLEALASQANIALSTARLFDEVSYMKNYNESILNSIATGVVTFDLDGYVTTANPAAQKIFALRSDFIDRHVLDLFGGDNEELIQAVGSVFASREHYTGYEHRYFTPAGDVFGLNLNVIPLQSTKGDLLGVVLVAQDITYEQRLFSTLSRYVAREVAARLVADKDALKLGGSRRDVTVLFSDIRGFTTLSEQYTADEIVQLLNEYFTRMVGVIFKYEGTLDKFIGDAIMAVFGAPVEHDDDPVRAVLTAIEMRRELRRYNDERAARGEATIDTGIGICFGEALSGNIGSELRMDYTVIGDPVNVASRIEGLTKDTSCKILISESVYERVKHLVPCVDLGPRAVKGRAATVRLYGIPEEVADVEPVLATT
ncbi:MAG: GAF domain-containing protein [Chloroflexi bacterium]|nr:GAF domain-containing protein [Chloroflexota bacterium]